MTAVKADHRSRFCGLGSGKGNVKAGFSFGVVLVSVFLSSRAFSPPVTAAPRTPLPPWPEAPLVRADFDGELGTGADPVADFKSSLLDYAESWSGWALRRDGLALSAWVLSGLASGGRLQLNGEHGGVRFWFSPAWSSAAAGGKGPGGLARLAELVSADGRTGGVLWSLYVSADGAVTCLTAQSGSTAIDVLKLEIPWTAGRWYCLALNYGPKGAELWVDGKLLATGAALPSFAPATAGLVIGSDVLGGNLAGGLFDEVTTFAEPLGEAELRYYLAGMRGLVALGPVSALEAAARAEAKAKLLAEREAAGGGQQMRMMVGGTTECFTNVPVYFTNVFATYDANQGWTVMFDVQGGESGQLYDIFTATNLVGNNLTNAQWEWLERGPTCSTYQYTNQPDTNACYALGTPQDTDGDGLTDAFEQLVSKSLPTNADSDGDGMPDGWEWKHFGTMSRDGTRDYDGDTVTDAAEFAGQTEPNDIKALLQFTNLWVATTNPAGVVEELSGVPARMALLVNDTNFATAVWAGYHSNFTAALGPTDGVYQVWVGLRGLSDESKATWVNMPLTLDRTPPTFVVTSPAAVTGSLALVQLQGYAQEELECLRYDLTNATGLFTNLPAYLVGEVLDTNSMTFTTNYFQAYDVALRNGLNTVTLRAVDLAGNISLTSFEFVLEPDTHPPVALVCWPLDGMRVCGDTFTLLGWVDDIAASAGLTISSPGGATNFFAGAIERTGRLWFQGIPLSTGTNWLTLSAMDPWGNIVNTNWTVIRSDLNLAVTGIPTSDLHSTTVSVSGTLTNAGYTLWVNGVQAGITNGNWQADNVPVGAGATAMFAVTAYPPGENPTPDPNNPTSNPPSPNAENMLVAEDKPPRVYVEMDFQTWTYRSRAWWQENNQRVERTVNMRYSHGWWDQKTSEGSW
jgi:hypothetical protein